jgi:sugar O-acyltransferase (sialic acid O-acetyltransferase NeuD family)
MKLVLLGGGGHCASCIDVIRSAGLAAAGFLSPEPVAEFYGLPRLGSDDWIDSADARQAHFLVTVGQTGVSPLRARLFEALVERGLQVATIVAGNASVSESALIGKACIVMQRAVVNAKAVLGKNCIVNTGAIVEHDVVIGDHCHISTAAVVNGAARIGDGCMIGSGAVVLQGVSIAAGTVVGAGAVVTADIVEQGTWVGVPAKRVK